ncbi:RNA-directed DNA polymerase, eukaryota, reverse transcriptase zinc-binding domain protein [Tanacetum coccineum]
MSRCHNWNPLVDRFHKRLSKWKSKTLSIGGRLTLIKSVLGSLGVYYFSTFKAPIKVINKLEGIRRNFFWGGSLEDKKIPWIAWDNVISPYDRGGLGIGSLRTCNQAMLVKWWWRFHTEKQAMWCKVIRSIHGSLGGLNEYSAPRPNSGPWYHIAKLKDDLRKVNINLPSLFKKKLGNGRNTSFWNEIWVGDSPLISSFPRLFRLETDPDCLVYDRKPIARASSSVLATAIRPSSPLSPPGLNFTWAWRREPRPGREVEELVSMVSLISNLFLSDVEDCWEFTGDASRRFSVKGMRSLISSSSQTASLPATRWNKVLPLKININTWRVLNGRMATRVNLDRRGIDLNSLRCPICDDDIETEKHIFVHCELARDTWKDVLRWWHIPNTSFQYLQDVISLADHSPLQSKSSRFFDAVVQTTIWSLWRFRNNTIFSTKRPSRVLLFNDIKTLSYHWITSRCRNSSFNWIEWFDNPCRAISHPCN